MSIKLKETLLAHSDRLSEELEFGIITVIGLVLVGATFFNSMQIKYATF